MFTRQSTQQTPCIVIDARSVTLGSNNGIARHTDEIVKSLINFPNKYINFIILTSPQCPYNKAMFSANFSFKTLKYSWSSVLGLLELTYVINKIRPTLFHSPSYMIPLYGNTKFIATLHDLIHVFMPKDYTIFHKIYYNFFLKTKLQKALCVLTVSNSSKQDIISHFNLPPNQVHVLYNGLSEEFLKSDAYLTPEILNNVKQQYNLPEKFILGIGNPKPHKNLATLIKTWASKDYIEDLVIVSSPLPSFFELAKQYNKQHRLHVISFIAGNHMPALYKLSSVFVFPSLYEGFGFPPLEAMACGVPVISSNKSSLPEILDKYASYVSPNNEDEIASAITKILHSDNTINDNLMKGMMHAKSYTWKAATEQIFLIYNNFLQK